MMSFTPKKLLVVPMAAAVLSVITACGTSEEREYAYRNAESIKSVEMPPGLTMLHSKESLEIPEQTATKLASIEELEKPPSIIDAVDLKFLDEEDAKPASADKNTSSETVATAKKPAALSITSTKDDDGNSLLIVNHDFETVFPLVKPALLELGFKIDDASKGGELYAISKALPKLDVSGKPVHPGDAEPEVKEEFQIYVKPSGEETKISVRNKFGDIEGSGLADHLLLQIKEIMENPRKVPGSNS